MKATPEQRQQLRDGFKASLAAYEQERAEREARLNTPPPPNVDPRARAIRDAFLLTGDIAEYVHALRELARDTEDRAIQSAVAALRTHVTQVGDLLTRKQNEPAGRSPVKSAPNRPTTRKEA